MPNKNIVNYEKLRTIFEALWNKIKEQFIKSVRLEDNTLKFEKGNGSIVDVNYNPDAPSEAYIVGNDGLA